MPVAPLHNGVIEHPEKIGIGTWETNWWEGTSLNDADNAGIGWYYNWSTGALNDTDSTPEQINFVPMIWDETNVTAAELDAVKASGAGYLLGFNEPDHKDQANMTVAQALALWPQLQATGLRLGSPACTTGGTFGWLSQFMTGAAQKGLRVDFINVHYYSTNTSVQAFKDWLIKIHDTYGKPIWVTEWSLADWKNPDRFSAAQQAAFAKEAIQMMDDLDFVERHAWFAAYDGGDGWDLNTGLFDDTGALTAVGDVFVDLIQEGNESVAAAATQTINGTSRAEIFEGTDNRDIIYGNGNNDQIRGKGGNDSLYGGDGYDVLYGGAGADALYGGAQSDSIYADGDDKVIDGGAGRDTLYVEGTKGVTLDLGVASIETAYGGSGNDVFSASKASADYTSFKVYGNGGNDSISGFTGFDSFYGGDGNDTLVGNDGNDSLYGEAGNDLLIGGEGVDKLYGGAGNDRLEGGAGNDVLEGGAGNDVFIGGAGGDTLTSMKDGVQDTFTFAAGAGRDSITGFERGIDIIDLTAYNLSSINNVVLQSSGTGTTLLVGGDQIFLVGELNLKLADMIDSIRIA